MGQEHPPHPDLGQVLFARRDGERLARRPLPNHRPDRTWAGPSGGAECVICQRAVPPGELEFEVDFERDGSDVGVDTYHLHASCYRAWSWQKT